MKILEVWAKVKAVEVVFDGAYVSFIYRTEPCAQHCGSFFKANPAFMVGSLKGCWSC